MTNSTSHISNFVPHEESFLINFGSEKGLRPIRISLPSPPPPHLIHNHGLPRDKQVFRRMKFPRKLKELESECYEYFEEKRAVTNYDIQTRFWQLLKERAKQLAPEIRWIKHFIWHMHHGWWIFIDGQPTFIPPWQFSYLHLHWMTLDKGEGLPTYDERQRRRFLFRHYIYNTKETFRDLDENGYAVKVDGKYRMKDTENRTFFGTVEPKSRREGLTNEFCHIITRIAMQTYGADNLCTIVSMDGDNAGTHFKKKLVPAFKRFPIWLKPIWHGGVTSIEFSPGKGIFNPNVKYLGSSINFTPSGGDLANDGKKIMGAGFDEQGKGKRIGNIRNRWQINKETMSLQMGAQILGFCIHPSTVEKMDEGGLDYKELADLSDFYQRGSGGQTMSGLSVSYMPTSFCLRGFTDVFGKPVPLKPTARQKALGYKRDIGSKTWIERRRRMLYDESDPAKMDEYRSVVRKFPEDYSDCWKGVAGFIGFPIEFMEERVYQLEQHSEEVQGRFEWINGVKWGKVEFVIDPNGDWTVSRILTDGSQNMKSSMMYFSAKEQMEVEMLRPATVKAILGLDPHEFKNESESKRMGTGSRLSSTGMAVVSLRDTNIDKTENKKEWKTVKTWAVLEKRFGHNDEVAEEAIKAAIYYGALIHIERNKTEVLARIIDARYGGYLNHMLEALPMEQYNFDPQAGTHLNTVNKKRMFSLAKDFFVNHAHNESIKRILKDGIEISSMEDLTKYDVLAAWMHAILGSTSLYRDYMAHDTDDGDITRINAIGRAV